MLACSQVSASKPTSPTKEQKEEITVNASDWVWLAADYHFPATYSCRVPMSSMCSALALPAPGPATVRLALIRTGIELFGVECTRDKAFPIIRLAEICIKPPEKVAMSIQLTRAYKASTHRMQVSTCLDESPIYREVAHATGLMTVYIHVPTSHKDMCSEMLKAIGYWGQASSLTCCVVIHDSAPTAGEYALPLEKLNATLPTRRLFSCVVSEFRDGEVCWDDILPDLSSGKGSAIKMTVYVWPMVICERRSGGKLLVRRLQILK